jgi:hypothetical protein
MNAADNLVARLTECFGSAAPQAVAFLEAQFPDPVERLEQLRLAVAQAESLAPKRHR